MAIEYYIITFRMQINMDIAIENSNRVQGMEKTAQLLLQTINQTYHKHFQFGFDFYICPRNFFDVLTTLTRGKHPSAFACLIIEKVADIVA